MHAYRLIRSNRRTISLEVRPGGEVIVRAPQQVSEQDIRFFIQRHTDWLNRKLAQSALPAQREFRSGERFLYQGQSFPLRITVRQKPDLVFVAGTFFLTTRALPRAEQVFLAWYRKQARLLFKEYLDDESRRMGLRYAALRLSSAQTRWGSCAQSGSINLNWRLILAPPAVVRYVVIHELAHLQHRNHSPDFWRMVEKWCPDWKTQRKWLREHGNTLTIR